jgi:8-oxo-dGTP diphosphatase
MHPGIAEAYGHKVRVRVCGLCWSADRLLLVNHRGLASGDFWAPPGGGVDFGETAEQCLVREFREETGMEISVGSFLFACEFIQKPLHAIELFFEVTITGGHLRKGDDPEWPMVEDVRFMSPEELASLDPANLHGIFGLNTSPEKLRALTGFFRL